MKLMRSTKTTSTGMDGTITSDLRDLRIVAYRRGLAPRPPARCPGKSAVVYSGIQPSSSVKRTQRYIPKEPVRILDAPSIRDDFYLNPLDWGRCNILSVALDNIVYFWNGETGVADQLDEYPSSQFVSSLKWSVEGKYLSVGLSDGSLRIYDPRTKKLLRTLSAQNNRVGGISWKKSVISYGTRDGSIYHHDVRDRNSMIG